MLLKRLEETVAEVKKLKNQEFHAAAIYLSLDAKASAEVDKDKLADEAKRLVEEAKKRDDLYARMEARAKEFKEVDIGVFAAEGPKDYNLNPKADVTVLFCSKHRVVMNRAYGPQGLSEEDVDKIMTRVKETLEPPTKKK